MPREIQRGATAQQQQQQPTSREGFRPRGRVVSDEPVCHDCGLQIGQCGCGGGAPAQTVIYVDRTTGQQVAPPASAGTPFAGVMAGVGVNSAAVAADRSAAAAGAAAGAAAAGWLTGLVPQEGCFPPGMAGENMGWMAQALRPQSWRPAPYQDAVYDWCNMGSLFSTDTEVAAGAAVEIQLSPSQGTFGAFYYDLVVTDADGIERSDWTFTQPRVQNCPVPNNSTNAIKAQYGQQTPAQCCGIPIRAFLARRSDNAPLVTTVTNNQAAGSIFVQLRVRGYPCSAQVCW